MPITKVRTASPKRKFDNWALGEVDKALEAAFFYGFTPIKKPALKKEDQIKAKSFDEDLYYADLAEDLKHCHKIEGKISLLRKFAENPPQNKILPLMFSYRVRDRSNHSPINLATLGVSGSVVEIISIKTTLTILSEHGFKDLKIEVNSVGDKESFSRFEKEFSHYLRKNLGLLPDALRQDVKKELREIFKYHDDDISTFWENAPKPINFLTPVSIKHLKEVLECLDNLEVPYNINHFLIPYRQCCHHTVFRIINDKEPVALGIRHYNLGKRLGLKKDIPLFTVAIKDCPTNSKKTNLKRKKPKFYLVQFGNRAKMKSLFVIEILRKAGIPLYHSLVKDKLVGQLEAAESLHLPYIIIIGEKEALEEAVAVRNMETRVQETVPILNLVDYLKRLRV